MVDWPAARPVFKRLAAAFDSAATAHLRGCGSRTVLVGCSGGADSVALLLGVAALLEESDTPYAAACFNHGQRPEAAAESAHVRELCGALGIRFYGGAAGLAPGLDEAALREARYTWLGAVYREIGAGALCLGHHGDDVLETQLMAVLSGSGPAGLAAPQPVKEFADGHVRVRPFVNLRRADLVKALVEVGVDWCEDASNADGHHTRNWMRMEWIPAAQERLQRNLVGGARRTRKLMEEAVDALDFTIRGLALDLSKAEGFAAGALRGQPLAVCRRALLGWWMRHHGKRTLGVETADALVAALALGQGVSVGVGPDASLVLEADGGLRWRSAASPRFTWPPFRKWRALAGPLALPDGAVLAAESRTWEAGEAPFREADPRQEAWIADCPGAVEVRQWQPGDRYRPLGAPGRRKLQDLFTDRGIAVAERHRLPVIVDGAGLILWVPGLAPAHERALTPGCKSALRLTYHRPCSRF